MRRRTVCQIPLRSTNTNITNYTTFTVPCVDNILLILKHLFMSFSLSGFGGLGVSVLASGTGVCGFKPGRTRRIFRAKKSSARLPSEGEVKPSVPCRTLPHVKDLNMAWKSSFGLNLSDNILAHRSTLLGSLASCRRGGTWRRRFECLKTGGKVMATSP